MNTEQQNDTVQYEAGGAPPPWPKMREEPGDSRETFCQGDTSGKAHLLDPITYKAAGKAAGRFRVAFRIWGTYLVTAGES